MQTDMQTSVKSRFDNLFSMSHNVSIVLPSTYAIDGKADNEILARVHEHVITVMSESFGGCTITDGQGAWYSNELAKLVYESVKIATSFANELGNNEHSTMLHLAEFVKAELRQESVLITLDGIAYLV